MLNAKSAPLSAESLARIHRGSVADPAAILALLREAKGRGASLRGRRTLAGKAESARILAVDSEGLHLEVEHLQADGGPAPVWSFELDGRSYLFSARIVAREGDGRLRLARPACVYESDRRDRMRQPAGASRSGPSRVEIEAGGAQPLEARVADWSASGLAVELPERTPLGGTGPFPVRYLDGSQAGRRRWAVVRHELRRPPSSARPGGGGVADSELVPERAPDGWRRLGLAVSDVPQGPPCPVEERRALLRHGPVERLRSQWTVLGAGARVASAQAASRLTRRAPRLPDVELVDFCNARGERLRGIVNATGRRHGALAVVIPPAWGRTKETLLPLAATLVASFRRAGEPVVVLRFDGTRRRGESFQEPDCLDAGHEHDRFTVSGCVEDIHGAVRFLSEDDRFKARGSILVTFSAASIEGRRAVAEDGGRRIRGWVSVVGTPDLQSGMRTVAGGIDYFGGAERGARFGFQEIMGIRVDIDRVADDALEHGLTFLEDARRDMARIQVPVTWIHGRNDAWLDLQRVRDIMGCGDPALRRLISVPTGHQLRSSREALEVFQLVAQEVGRIDSGRELRPALPDLPALERARRAERARRPRREVDLQSFWKDYLVGRNESLGIELMNATDAYGELMRTQIEALALRPGERVADLGCGTGPFELALAESQAWPAGLRVDAFDYVPAALARAGQRLGERFPSRRDAVRFVAADLNRGVAKGLPLRTGSYDAVLASLLLSYLAEPEAILRRIHALLRPGGRLVVSSLRLDADVSGLFTQGLRELRAGRARELFGPEGEREIDAAARSFLNDAARILDLEEEGAFRFWEPADFEALVRRAGFTRVRSRLAFGEPAQAVVVAGVRP